MIALCEVLSRGISSLQTKLQPPDGLERPIPKDPKKPIEGWKEVPIKGSKEPLVPLAGPHSPYLFGNDAIYVGERFTSPYIANSLEGGLITPFLRKGPANLLMFAQTLLPEGHLFVIWDAYRTVEVQASLFDQYKDKLKQRRLDLHEADLLTEAQKFVSLPSTEEARPSPHNTGGVVDLTIARVPLEVWRKYIKIRDDYCPSDDGDPRWMESKLFRYELLLEHSEPLNMGTPFDYVSPETATNYYECLEEKSSLTEEEKVIRNNRRLIYNSLTSYGFVNYPEEWWHYSYGDQMWAKASGKKKAIYGSTELSDENKEFEYYHREFFYDGHIKREIKHPDAAEI